jgi:thiol-disulfide isomerase/thioredoxin
MTDENRKRRTATIVMLAAIAGLAAGAVAVYVSRQHPGNRIETADRCADRADFARAVGAAATGEVAAMAAADPVSLSALSFDAPDGSRLRIADFSGRTILLNLWATWCAPCRAEMPALDRLQGDMGGEAFEVVAVNVEKGSAEKPKAFLEEIGVRNLAFYRDETLTVFNELRARSLALGLPVTLLIDAEGCLLANMNGPAEWGSEDAKRLIGTALAGK